MVENEGERAIKKKKIKDKKEEGKNDSNDLTLTNARGQVCYHEFILIYGFDENNQNGDYDFNYVAHQNTTDKIVPLSLVDKENVQEKK